MPEPIGDPSRLALYEKCLEKSEDNTFKELVDYLFLGNGNDITVPRKLAIRLVADPKLVKELIELIKILKNRDEYKTLNACFACFDEILKEHGYGGDLKDYAGYWATRNNNDFFELSSPKAKEMRLRDLVEKLTGTRHTCVVTDPNRKPIGIITQGDIHRVSSATLDTLVVDFVQDQQLECHDHETHMSRISEYINANDRDESIIIQEGKFIGVVTKEELNVWRIRKGNANG